MTTENSRPAMRSWWRRRVRPVVTGMVVLSLAALVTGVTGGASVASTARPHAKYTFVLVPGLTTDPFYITMHAGAFREAQKLGVTLKWVGTPTWDTSQQIPVVNALLATHPSALLIAPTDVVALKAPIAAFVKAHIPVITVDTTINDTALLTSRITSDNFQGGAEAADTIARLAHDKGDVAVINVEKGISTTDARQAGFLAEMKKYSKMKVVASVYDQDSPSTAESEARAIMLANPGLVGIFGTNLFSAEGAGSAVQAVHKKGKVFVAGYDAEPAEVALLKQGVINVLVIQKPSIEGARAVKFAMDAVTGHLKAIPKSTLLTNVTATTADANSPSIKQWYYISSFKG